MLILASNSPRRKELLAQIGVACEVIPGTYAEDVPGRDNPEKFVDIQAAGKAASVADTVVAADGKILGKPRHEAEAVRMLAGLSGRSHAVYTGVALQKGDVVYRRVEKTIVTFRTLGEEEISAYVASGEPMDKAGAYGIQGKGAVFVERIDGDYANVVGLPLCAVYRLMRDAGITV